MFSHKVSYLLLNHGDHGLVTNAGSGNERHDGAGRGASPVAASTALLGWP